MAVLPRAAYLDSRPLAKRLRLCVSRELPRFLNAGRADMWDCRLKSNPATAPSAIFPPLRDEALEESHNASVKRERAIAGELDGD